MVRNGKEEPGMRDLKMEKVRFIAGDREEKKRIKESIDV